MPVDPPPPPFNVYRDQLTSQYRGLALWNPTPPKRIYDHVSIGDVGYVHEGVFIRMFNVILPWDHESNKTLGEPEPYESLDCGPITTTLDVPFKTQEHHSRDVSIETNDNNVQAKVPDDAEGVTYNCRGHGALLFLPHGGRREDNIHKKVFEDYIRAHVVSWFTWAQKNRQDVERMEDLVLVSGCTLVSSWAAAAFVYNTMDAKISLARRTLNNGWESFVWGNIRGAVEHHDSDINPLNPFTIPDQCVFIRGFRAKRVLFWTKSMRAAAEPRPDEPDNRRDDEIQVTRVADGPEYRDPLVAILDYIVERCSKDAQAEDTIAIAHDDDLRLIKDVEVLTADAIEEFLREKQMPLHIENGAAILRDSAGTRQVTVEGHEGQSQKIVTYSPLSSAIHMARSSGNSTPPKPMFFNQDLIDIYTDNIEARVVHEKDLQPTHLQWLLGPDGNSPRSVGISPAYFQSGSLPALACALDTRVLVINFHTYRDGATSSGTKPRNVQRRRLLECELLCYPLCTIYAFDLANIALSLHFQLQLHITDAIDIQSALQIPDRSVVLSVQCVIADACKIRTENIDRAFKNMTYQSSMHKDLTDLAQRAWLCSYIGRYDLEPIKDMFYKAPKVDTAKFSEDELNVLQKVAYDMLRKDNMKPQTVTHEIKTRWGPRKEQMVAVSQRYANRITQNSTSVKIALAHGSDASFSLRGGASDVRGKTAGLDVEPNLEGKLITSTTTTGRDGPTQAELDCSNAILSMLQETLPLLDDHWMKAIWLPSEPVVWPFTPPPNAPAMEIVTHPNAPLNTSQRLAVTKMLSSSLEDNITLIQGPPGTGKTTAIATYVLSVIKARQRGTWLMAESNVAVKNIAEKLLKLDFINFKLLVSKNFHLRWHLYGRIEENIIVSDEFAKPGRIKKALQGTQVILCTLSMISNPKLAAVTRLFPIVNVIIDEASQIRVGQYVPLFKTFSHSLRKVCFVGDDKQLPPRGQDDLQNLQSIFEVDHLRENLTFLDTQYRMPPQIGEFISQHVYDHQLLSDENHVIPSSTIACRFIDVNGIERLDSDGNSTYNRGEVDAIVLLAQHLQDENISFRIITPYDAQRSALEWALREKDLNWEDKCFNVDSFQGNEDHVIIISVVQSKALGFLANTRHTNVMLTRCQRGMYIVSSRAFLEGKGADSLVGKMAAELGNRPGAWLSYEDLKDGKFE